MPLVRWFCSLAAVFALVPAGPGATPAAPSELLLDATNAGDAVIAVGERGMIVRSTDAGRTWAAAPAATTATLTGVSFAGAAHGWAVGHDGLILVTADGGRTWRRQWQSESLTDSFLDVLAVSDTRVIAIGAYGLYVTTADAGQSWTRRKLLPDDYHLNRISQLPGGPLFIAGEHGTLLHSADGGERWDALPAPYDGSFYGILPLNPTTLLAYGLRGRLFRSGDSGATWQSVATPAPDLLATAVQGPGGVICLAGQTRSVLVSRDGGKSFERRDVGVTSGIAELLPLPDGTVLAFGEAGVSRIAPNALTTRAGSATPPTAPGS